MKLAWSCIREKTFRFLQEILDLKKNLVILAKYSIAANHKSWTLILSYPINEADCLIWLA